MKPFFRLRRPDREPGLPGKRPALRPRLHLTAARPARAAALPVLVIYTLLALGLTYPFPRRLTTTVPNDIGDPLLNTWILAWVSRAFLTDPGGLFQANIFHPLPTTLAYSEHLISTALLALPLQLFFGEPILAYNLSLLTSFPLAALGMYLLTLRWTGQRRAAFISGLIFAFSPYRFAAVAHLQLLTFQWLPFALLCLDKILASRPTGPASRPPSISANPRPALLFTPPRLFSRLPLYLAFTLFLLLQILASWYLAIYTALIISLYLLIRLATQSFQPARLPLLLAAFLISGLLILPAAWPYLLLLDELRAARPLSTALSLAAAPTDFLAAAPFNRFAGPLTAPFRSRTHFTEENTLFLGLLAPLLAGAALALLKKPKKFSPGLYLPFRPPPSALPNILALLAILFIALLLTFPLPYTALATLFPPSTVIRVPARWIIPASFALAGLAAYGYLYLSTRLATFLPPPGRRNRLPITSYQLLITIYHFLIPLLLIAEALSIPLPLAPVENRQSLNPAYPWLAAQPDEISLIELPLHSAPDPEFPEVKRLYASTLGWPRLINGYSGYTPPRQPVLAQAVHDFPRPAAVTALQSLAAGLPPETLPLFLLVHPGEAPFDRSQWETGDRWRAARNPALLPLGRFEGDYLYQIRPSVQYPARPAAMFGEGRHIRLLDFTLDRPPPGPARPSSPRLILQWQAGASLPTDYTVFIHLRAPDGFIRSQADGPPVNGHYPTSAWRPGEIVQDIHSLPPVDAGQVDHLAIGLYDPRTGERLPAFDPAGERWPEDAVLVPLSID